MVSVYSAAHFLVDFACAFLMFRSVAASPEWYFCVLLYNFFAFAAQMPLGIAADKLNRNYLFALSGCLLVGAAYAAPSIPAAAAATAGLGNGMFHIGGGIDVLNICDKKSAALGVFVSPGAFGIYFGTIAGKGDILPAALVLAALLAAAALIAGVYKAQRGTYPKNAELSFGGGASRKIFTAVICLFIVVCLRSYAGLTLNFPWKGIGGWGTVLVCAAVFGKTLGGFAADRFGALKTAAFSLGCAALLSVFPSIPLAGVASVLLFNMTMPVTLMAMAKIFPGAKGFSFGLLTFALFCGFVPVHLGAKFNAPRVFFAVIVISLILLCISLRKADVWTG